MGGVGSALEAESQPGCFMFPFLKEGHKDTKGILPEHNGLHSYRAKRRKEVGGVGSSEGEIN